MKQVGLELDLAAVEEARRLVVVVIRVDAAEAAVGSVEARRTDALAQLARDGVAEVDGAVLELLVPRPDADGEQLAVGGERQRLDGTAVLVVAGLALLGAVQVAHGELAGS